MLCVKCQKRPAVVFVQRLENGKTVQEGYCLTCARAMHIQPCLLYTSPSPRD